MLLFQMTSSLESTRKRVLQYPIEGFHNNLTPKHILKVKTLLMFDLGTTMCIQVIQENKALELLSEKPAINETQIYMMIKFLFTVTLNERLFLGS